MHHTITKKLYDAFPPERKSDFWAGYLYLKYTEYFFNKALEVGGMQPKELPPLDPAVEEMLYAVAWEVSEKAMSAETSLYHGKIVRLQDAYKLVTQKEDLKLSRRRSESCRSRWPETSCWRTPARSSSAPVLSPPRLT